MQYILSTQTIARPFSSGVCHSVTPGWRICWSGKEIRHNSPPAGTEKEERGGGGWKLSTVSSRKPHRHVIVDHEGHLLHPHANIPKYSISGYRHTLGSGPIKGPLHSRQQRK